MEMESQQEKSPPCFTRSAPMVYNVPICSTRRAHFGQVRERDKNNDDVDDARRVESTIEMMS